MSNWPVISAKAEYERDQLMSSHRPVPLPAYDISGDLISPERCKAMLGDAIVRVTFTLAHWFIDSSRKEDVPSMNTFVADVQSIRVLVNSPSQTMSPQKRKTHQRDPSDKFLQKKVSKK